MTHVTDRTPYTYVITHIPTGKKYYGSRYAKNCTPDDLWNTYFTSSQSIKEIVNEQGVNSFTYSVRKTFTSVAKCRDWESKFLHKIDARNNSDWLNKHNGGSSFYNDQPASDLTRERMSKARLGKPKSERMKQNSLRNFKLFFHDSNEVEYIRGSVAVLARLGRKDWETIRVCITHKNGFVPRANVTITRVPKPETL